MKRGRPKDLAVIDKAWECLAATGGSTRRAAKRLEAVHGIKTSPASIHRWREEDPERYEALRQDLAPKLEATTLAELRENSKRAVEVARESIEETHVGLQKGGWSPMETSTIARNLQQVATQGFDKQLLLEGRPQKITETKNLDELVQKLEGLGVAHRVVDVEVGLAEITEGQEDTDGDGDAGG